MTVSLTKRVSGLRSAINETKAEVILLLVTVDIETSCDLILEVVMDLAGVVLDLDLSHSWDSQKHVLIVDEGLVSAVKGLVIIPFSPVEAVQ